MHTRHIQKCNVRVKAWLGIYITPLTDEFSMVVTILSVEDVSWELLSQVSVNELGLWGLVVAKYDLRCVLLRGVVDRQS